MGGLIVYCDLQSAVQITLTAQYLYSVSCGDAYENLMTKRTSVTHLGKSKTLRNQGL